MVVTCAVIHVACAVVAAVVWADFLDEASNVQGRISVTFTDRGWVPTDKGLPQAGEELDWAVAINHVILHPIRTVPQETF